MLGTDRGLENRPGGIPKGIDTPQPLGIRFLSQGLSDPIIDHFKQ
jgi:hypothetical protein